MARPQMPASEWLDRVASMRRRAKAGDTANLALLAKGLGITPDYFRRQHIDGDPEFPVAATGTEGRDYVFDVVPALNHLFWRASEKVRISLEEKERAEALMGMSGQTGEAIVEADGLGPVTITDLGRLIDINLKQEKARAAQGDTIPAAVVSDGVVKIYSLIQSTILGRTQRVDPLGKLPVEQRALIDADNRRMCIDLSESIQREFSVEPVVGAKQAARGSRKARKG